MKSWISVVILFQFTHVDGQSVNTLIGARAAGLGYASSTLIDGASLFNNVGALGWLKKSSCFVAYEVQPNLPGANRTAAGLSLATRWATTGIGFFRFGDDVYNEQVVSAAIGNKFGIASLGAKANYVQYHANGFGINTALSLDFGGLAQITPHILIGAFIVNVTQSSLTNDERLPTKLTAGIGFKPSDSFFLITEIEKDLGYQATWRVGTEYTVHKKIFLRTGFNLHPTAAFMGVGAQARRLRIDYAIQYSNPFMGTHQASALISLERKSKR